MHMAWLGCWKQLKTTCFLTKVNAEIAERRQVRLLREAEDRAARISEELKVAEQQRLKKVEEANRVIEAETQAIENRIREEDLDRVIEAALQNPIDHEFAIDLQGNIYRGRYTKSIEVSPQSREKIPVPPTIAEKILAGQTSF